MKRKIGTSIAACLLVTVAAVGGLLLGPAPADAQQEGVYEYGYLVAVQRLESYEIDLSRWAGSAEDKAYIESHVFVYEEGKSDFDRHVNSLRKLNELAADGWEVVDADAGVMRRLK